MFDGFQPLFLALEAYVEQFPERTAHCAFFVTDPELGACEL